MKTFSQPHTEDLSFSQQNIWNLEQALPHTPINHISTTLFIDEGFDAEALQRTLNAIVEHDETAANTADVDRRPAAPVFCSVCFPILSRAGFLSGKRSGIRRLAKGNDTDADAISGSAFDPFLWFSDRGNVRRRADSGASSDFRRLGAGAAAQPHRRAVLPRMPR